MPADYTTSKVTSGETSSAAKLDAFVQAVQDMANAIGDTSKMGWAAGQIIDLSQLKPSAATLGQVATYNGSAWAPATPGGAGTTTVYKKTTEKDVVNTAATTDLLNGEITIGAGLMTASGALKLSCGGDYLNNSAATRSIRMALKLGSTTLWDSGVSSSIAASVNRRAWRFQAEIQAFGATNSQRGGGLFILGDSSAATTGSGIISDSSVAGTALFLGPLLTVAGAVDMTAAQTLVLNATHSAANASLSIRLEWARIEVT